MFLADPVRSLQDLLAYFSFFAPKHNPILYAAAVTYYTPLHTIVLPDNPKARNDFARTFPMSSVHAIVTSIGFFLWETIVM